MFFWIYMTAMAALIPGIMIGFGRMFSKAAPGKINGTFGYRTARSYRDNNSYVAAIRATDLVSASIAKSVGVFIRVSRTFLLSARAGLPMSACVGAVFGVKAVSMVGNVVSAHVAYLVSV